MAFKSLLSVRVGEGGRERHNIGQSSGSNISGISGTSFRCDIPLPIISFSLNIYPEYRNSVLNSGFLFFSIPIDQ